MRGIRYLFWILIVITPNLSFANTSFAVAPGRLNFDLRHPQTQTFLIRNNGNQLIHLRIHPTFLPIESRALNAGKPLNSKQEKKESLAPFILISPPVLSLRPGEQRDVRVSVRPSAHLKTGTYRAHLIVHMLEIFHQHFSKHKTSNGTVGMNLNFLMEIAVAVYAHNGNGTVKFTTACHFNKKRQLVVNVKNPTPWHFDGKATLYDKNNTKSILANKETVVYRNSLKKIYFDHIAKNIKNITIKWKAKTALAPKLTTHCHIHASE